jgi:integrase
MKAYVASQKWMPPVSSVPIRVQKSLLPFTPSLKGWNIWYLGKTRTVCGITTPLEEVSARWEKRKAEIDAEVAGRKPRPATQTLRQAVSDYFQWLDYRVKTGKPRPLAQISADDYKRNLVAFGRFQVDGHKFADMALVEFGPELFRPYAESLATRAPSSVARIVATVSGFFSYCRDEGRMAAIPNYGRYFARPPQSLIRDRRMRQQKSFQPEEICTLVEQARVQERAWIGLALCGAMDNSDIGHLTFSLFDKDGMLLDYRRRKQGLVPRLIPLHPVAREWLDEYLAIRPKPADPANRDLVFLTPAGLPLRRVYPSPSGICEHGDYVAECWDLLMRRAGLRAKRRFNYFCAICGKQRVVPPVPCCGRRSWKRVQKRTVEENPSYKGFRSLRTTFANLTPRGFSEERKLIMGHTGDITLDHYVEKYGTKHLRRLVDEVWLAAFTSPWPKGSERRETESTPSERTPYGLTR